MPAPSPSPAISPVRCPILVSASSVRLTLPCDALPSRLTQAMIAQASRSSSIPNSSSSVMGSNLVLDQFAIAFTGEWRDLRYDTGSGSDLALLGAATTEAPGRYRSLYRTAAVPYTHLQTAISPRRRGAWWPK